MRLQALTALTQPLGSSRRTCKMSETEREHYYVNKWLTVAACSLLQLSAGLPYGFGIFGAQLKRIFGWSQAELAGLGTALNLGAFSSFIPGFLFSALKSHESGPRCAGPS